MPMYEYRCKSCGDKFEMRQKFSDEPVKVCPQCSGEVEKVISAAAFSLKGGGWYSEGYSSEKPSPAPACQSGGSCAGCPSAAA